MGGSCSARDTAFERTARALLRALASGRPDLLCMVSSLHMCFWVLGSQRGWIDRRPLLLCRHLAAEAEAAVAIGEGGTQLRVLFLMPCHSTPFHASLHPHRLEMRFLDCSPPPPPPPPRSHTPGALAPPAVLSEDSAFYADPEAGAATLLDGNSSGDGGRRRYTHVVAFDRLAERLAAVLGDRGYREQARFFHSHGATVCPCVRLQAVLIYFCCLCLARMPCRADGTCGGVRVANGARANADVMQHDDRQSGYVVVLVEDGHAARLKAAKRKRGAADNDREDL